MSDTVTKELYHSKGQVWDEYKHILSQYSEDEEISPEDKQALDRLDAQFKAIRENTERKQNEAEMEKFFNTVDTSKRLPVTKQDGTVEERIVGDEIKAFNALIRGSALQKANRQVPQQWLPYLQGKVALNRTTDGQGGYLTPDIYAKEFVNKKYLGSLVRQAPVRTFRMTSDVMRIPTINAASSVAILTSEGSAFSQVEPTVTEVVFTAYKYTRIELSSEELVADANFDLLSEVVLPDMAQAFAAAENTAFTTGTGSSQPQGIITGATSTAMATGNTTTITGDEIIGHYHRLPLQYRNTASVGWMANDATISKIRQLKDGSGGAGTGNYLWQPGLALGQPDRLLGRPIYPNNSMATMAANAKVLLVADFQYFRIGDRLDLAINTLVERYAELGQVAFRGQSRFDSHVMIAEAVQVLANSAT